MTPKTWRPQEGPQTKAIRKPWVEELFFGGARGGGKSDFLLGDFAQDVPMPYGQYWRGILFRKTYAELEELITRSKQIYPDWFPNCEYSESSKTWRFHNGATLKMRYLEADADANRYQGHSYTWIGWDELGNWSKPNAYNMLKATLRSAHGVPNKRIRATGNPGGHGHQWIKQYFAIDQYPLGDHLLRDSASGQRRMFIKSRLQDNKILLHNDPNYQRMLQSLGSEALVRAWLDGDWDVVAGAFFTQWRVEKHVLAPFTVPTHWLRFVALDWGSAAPFSVGWWAVSDGGLLPDGRQYPAGCLIRYREWYGSDDKGEGLRLTAEQLADGIRARSVNDKIIYRIADPACWKVDGGPSIAERMAKSGAAFRPADNSRINGWDQLRARLSGDAEGNPMIACFSSCVDSIRTIPVLQHDDHNLEDVDSDGEDHAADEWRYACMSRPWTRKMKPLPGEPKGIERATMEEVWKHFEQQQNDIKRV